MKKFLLIVFLYNTILNAQSNFENGFEAGYKQSYCKNIANCNLKITAIPKHNQEVSSFKDGLDLGKIKGAVDRLKNIHGSDFESVVGFSQLRLLNSRINLIENKQLYFIKKDVETAFNIASASKILNRAGETPDQYGPISQQHKLLVARYKGDIKRYQRDNSTSTSNEILLLTDDRMKYDKTILNAKTGQKITLTLKHGGKMSKSMMGHNFVLLKKGVVLSKFAQQAIAAKNNDYIPENTNDVIAHTKMLGGGESDTITFKAPAKGVYVYVCSFPGHFALMKGVLRVN
jgi:azurin